MMPKVWIKVYIDDIFQAEFKTTRGLMAWLYKETDLELDRRAYGRAPGFEYKSPESGQVLRVVWEPRDARP